MGRGPLDVATFRSSQKAKVRLRKLNPRRSIGSVQWKPGCPMMQVPVRLFWHSTNVICKDAPMQLRSKTSLNGIGRTILQSGQPGLIAQVKAPAQPVVLIGVPNTARTEVEGIQASIRPCLNCMVQPTHINFSPAHNREIRRLLLASLICYDYKVEADKNRVKHSANTTQ
jgi:hypothetical protein